MKFELRKIQFNERMSEETNNYAADLYIDGKKAAMVGNDGHGGCDRVYWEPEFRGREAEIEAFIKANFPPVVSSVDEFPALDMDLELLCDQMLQDHLRKQEEKKQPAKAKRLFAAKIVAHIPDSDKVLEWSRKRQGQDVTVPLRKAVLDKYPNAKLLNDMPLDEAVTFMRSRSLI